MHVAYYYIQHDVEGIVESMELTKLSEPLTCTWETFDSTMLSPLRVQMMGSVMVSVVNDLWYLQIFYSLIRKNYQRVVPFLHTVYCTCMTQPYNYNICITLSKIHCIWRAPFSHALQLLAIGLAIIQVTYLINQVYVYVQVQWLVYSPIHQMGTFKHISELLALLNLSLDQQLDWHQPVQDHYSQLHNCIYLRICRLVNWLLMKDGPSTLGEGLVITLLTLVEDWLCMMMSLCVWL